MLSVHETTHKQRRPIKILQFGEGNFLRAFVDIMIDVANEKGVFDGNVQIVKAVPFGSLDAFYEQDCVYTVLLRGKNKMEKRVITCVDSAVCAYNMYNEYALSASNPDLQFIVSNTTEAGIVYDENDELSLCPPKTFPGKLTKFLYERYMAFAGAEDKGLIILPVELIEHNGTKLKKYCLQLAKQWKLPMEFIYWLTDCNIFCNTLVDRIVTGYPKDESNALEQELGYQDKLLVAGEPYALWVVESEHPELVANKLPLDNAGLPVLFTSNYSPYRERKVRLLNGTHTAAVFVSLLAGLETVGDAMCDPLVRTFIEGVLYNELSSFVPLPPEEVKSFADSVLERFENPYIQHEWRSIALNSVSKFKTRLLPTILEKYDNTGTFPKLLCFSLAALIEYYKIYGPGNDPDSPDEILSSVPKMRRVVETYIGYIREYGINTAVEKVLHQISCFN